MQQILLVRPLKQVALVITVSIFIEAFAYPLTERLTCPEFANDRVAGILPFFPELLSHELSAPEETGHEGGEKCSSHTDEGTRESRVSR